VAITEDAAAQPHSSQPLRRLETFTAFGTEIGSRVIPPRRLKMLLLMIMMVMLCVINRSIICGCLPDLMVESPVMEPPRLNAVERIVLNAVERIVVCGCRLFGCLFGGRRPNRN